MTAKQRPEVTTIADTAKRLRIGRNQAYEAAARGDIPAIRIGKRWLVPTAALDRLLNGGEAADVSRTRVR